MANDKPKKPKKSDKMGITYSAGAGTQITSPAMTEVLPNQSQQTGNNTVVVSDTLGNIGGGQIGDGSNGTGDSYLNRMIIIDQNTASEQIRIVIADAAGTGTTRILTVNEDWDVNPVITTDTIYVAYELADIEDGGAGGGIALNTKSGLWEFGRILTINSTGILAAFDGQGIELADRGASLNFLIESGGFFYGGYVSAGAPIAGIELISFNNTAGEPSVQVASGGHLILNDTLIWSQIVPMQHECVNGSFTVYRRCKWLKTTEELLLSDAEINDCSIGGTGTSTENVLISDETVIDGLTLVNIQTLNSTGGAGTFEASGVQFVGVPDYVTVQSSAIWNLIDPIWDVTVYTQLTWPSSFFNRLNDRRSVTATVQEADGTKLENALVNVYEDTQTADLVLEAVTDVDGLASGSFILREHITNSVTNTYGGHSLQGGKWLFLPFVAAQASDEKFDGTIVLNPDNNIVQTTQATAKSAGSTVTWNKDTNPSSILSFTGGDPGNLAVGDSVTGLTSGADGIVTKIIDGDSVAGTVHLKSRDANTFIDGEILSDSTDWTATYTASTEQRFSIWIDAQLLSYQALYDYLAAIQNETTLTADGESIWEWCRNDQPQPLYNTGSSFFTERSNSEGIIVVDGGAGTLDYFTDDAGVQWIPPTTYSLAFTLNPSITGYEWRIYEASGTQGDGTIGTVELDGEESATLDNQTYVYTYAADQPIAVQILADGYEEYLFYETLEASNKAFTFNLTPETNA